MAPFRGCISNFLSCAGCNLRLVLVKARAPKFVSWGGSSRLPYARATARCLQTQGPDGDSFYLKSQKWQFISIMAYNMSNMSL